MTNYEVTSPCINLCKIDEPTQRCIGCDRSIEDITRWSTMDNDAKLAVIDDLVRRKHSRKKIQEQNQEQNQEQGREQGQS